MKKKVVLYFPTPFPYHRPWKGVPLAMLAISRVLDKEGYEVKIISRFLTDDPEAEVLAEAADSICVGISAMTGFQLKDGLSIAQKVRKKYPKLPIVWGGWHPSILPKETVRDKNVDIVVVGPGDMTFPTLVKALEFGKDLKTVPNIVYKKGRRVVFAPVKLLTVEELNSLPPLPYHLVDVEKCIHGTEYGKRTIPYISSYGCPFRCGFCVEKIVNKRRWLAFSAKRVVSEWVNLIKRYKADSIAVYDSNFFVDQKRTYDICQGLLKKKIKIKWGNANGRVGQLVKYESKVWQAMEKSGCSMILTGAESGSQEALDLIEKDMDVEEIVEFTRLCHKYHIKILYSFLVGLPWSQNPRENKKYIDGEYRSTLSLIDSLLKVSNRNRYTYYVFLPYPGAALYDRAVKLGLKAPKSLQEWSRYLMSPEDAFNTVINQKWITKDQARLTAMLTQYIFGLMDQDTKDMLKVRVKAGFRRMAFLAAIKLGETFARLRWRFKYFGFPVDYWMFTLVHKYGNVV